MTIWYLDARKYGKKGQPVPKKTAEPLIVNALAAEIVRLLTTKDPQTAAGDIAVLVRTNRQARMVKQGLTRCGIPAVLHSTGDIFDSPEAEELEALLGCIAHPTDTGRARRALVTQLWGRTATDLLALDADPERWQELLHRILDYNLIWQRQGFMRMFRQLLVQEEVAVRMMGLPEGERRLTNLLHLGEVLHHNAVQLKLNMLTLVNWLAEQRDPDTPRLDTHQLRMESDADAVRIVTIHKSKGLEYPVVFCPFCWEDSRVRGAQLQFHDPRQGYRPTLHLDARPEDDCHKWAQNEQLAENLRLLYVALTRAKSRCYLVWGRLRATDTSALAYLLHGRLQADRDPDNTDVVALLSHSMAGRSDADYLMDLRRLADECPGCLTIKLLPEDEPAQLWAHRVADQPFSRHFCGSIDRTRAVISYSTLVAWHDGNADLPDHDDLMRRWQPTVSVPAAGPEQGKTDKQPPIFDFAKGPRAGIFFHDLLEQMDYSLSARQSRFALVGRKLIEHGFESVWQESVTDLLQQVLEVNLSGQGTEFCLGQLGPEDRLHELEFHFSLETLTPERLVRLLEPHFKQTTGASELNRIKELAFRPACGFMKGFVDMVFVHQGRYYLVDWKSNFLGDNQEDYHLRRLQAAMDEHLYGLQSLIYTLALDQYLRLRLPGYRYENHFGGAYYFFLRGIRVDWGAQYGVHASRLEPAAVEALRSALIPTAPEKLQPEDGRR